MAGEVRAVGHVQKEIRGLGHQPHLDQGQSAAGEPHRPAHQRRLDACAAEFPCVVFQRVSTVHVDAPGMGERPAHGVICLQIHRAGVDRRDVRPGGGVQRQGRHAADATAGVPVVGKPAERRMDQDVAPAPDPANDVRVGLDGVQRGAVGIAGVEVDDAGALLPATRRGFRDFVGGPRHVRILLPHGVLVDPRFQNHLLHIVFQ